MQLSITTRKTRYRIFDPIRVLVRIENDGASPLDVCRELMEFHDFVDGREVYWSVKSWGEPPYVSVAPNGAFTLEHELALNYFSLDEAREAGHDTVRCTYHIALTALVDRQAHRIESPHFALEIDFSRTQPLVDPAGARSHYVLDDKRIAYVVPHAYRPESRARFLKTDPGRARVVSERYLVDDGAVYRDGQAQRGVTPHGFCVLNPIFARTDDVVLTTYGDAKVEHPKTFEVLDTAEQHWPPQAAGGYRAGYGRDESLVYYFDESTSTKHAVRLRGCKNPKAFVVLNHGFARDDVSVFHGSTRIQGADASTWRLLGRRFSRDARSAFYVTSHLPDADVESLVVVAAPQLTTPLDESHWAKDAKGYFERAQRRTLDEYITACATARKR